MRRTGVALGIMAILGIVVTFTPSCKKGPEDPLISFKSRDARIKGTWELKGFEYVYRRVNSYQNIQCSPLINSTVIKSEDGENFVVIDTSTQYLSVGDSCMVRVDQNNFTGHFKLTINKDGTYSYSSSFENISQEGSGYWFWSESRKNKQYIAFDLSINACVYGEFPGEDNFLQGQWYIERLSSKELILSSKCKSTTAEDGNTYTAQIAIRFVFAKIKKK
ncbi:MAG: hypothetical protein GXO48_01860 [Chlorobi bacterium]|nr:hypothetical protein [Chlorobiota bacterium]